MGSLRCLAVHVLPALFLVGSVFAPVSRANALTTLKQVNVTNASQIDLLFDGRIEKDQIKTEFFNDIVQVSLTGVSVYPAKISSITGGKLLKVFAYQYAPKLVRCRITVAGKADGFKDLLHISSKGKVLTVRYSGPVSDSIGSSAAMPERVALGGASDGSPAAKAGSSQASADLEALEEKAFRERVLKGSVTAADVSAVNENVGTHGPKSLGMNKKPLSPLSALWKLVVVLAFFMIVAFGVKRFLGRSGSSATSGTGTGMLGAIGRFARGKLGSGGKMIEVISTHHLGPKKSIAIVKVGGSTLVLGVTSESINLITRLSDDADDVADLGGLDGENTGNSSAASMAVSADGPMFSEFLVKSAVPTSEKVVASTNSARGIYTPASVRERIRSRLEGLKQL
jgi:flagellar biogenesis protein FliO